MGPAGHLAGGGDRPVRAAAANRRRVPSGGHRRRPTTSPGGPRIAGRGGAPRVCSPAMETPTTPASGSPVLDVDGTVASTEALVSRVEELIGRIDAEAGTPGATEVPGLAPLVDPVHGMRALHREMHPPEIGPGSGVRGRAGVVARKAVRRLTSWYVEPRFQVQEQFDAGAIEFASEAYNAIHRLEKEIEDLRRQVVRAKLEVVATGERLRRQQAVTDWAAGLVAHLEDVVRSAADQDEVRVLRQGVLDPARTTRRGNGEWRRHRLRGVRAAFPGRPGGHRRGPAPLSDPLPGARGVGHASWTSAADGARCWQMLADEGHDVMGVDMDAGMVQACLDQGLPAVRDDAVHFLGQTRPDSLKGVFCCPGGGAPPHLRARGADPHCARARCGPAAYSSWRRSTRGAPTRWATTSTPTPRTCARCTPRPCGSCASRSGSRPVMLEERSPHPALDLAGRPARGRGRRRGAGTLLESVFGYQDYVIVAIK